MSNDAAEQPAVARRASVAETCVAALVLVLSIGCRAAPPSRVEEITVWRPLGKWSGSNLQQTDAFISDTGLIRLTWEAKGAAEGFFRLTLHSSVSGRPLAVPVDRRGPGRDVTYVSEDPRSFYLVIESARLEWRVEAAEGIPATRRTPP